MWYWFLNQCPPSVGIHSLVKLEHCLLSSGFSSVQEQEFLKHDVTVSEVVPVDLFSRGLFFWLVQMNSLLQAFFLKRSFQTCLNTFSSTRQLFPPIPQIRRCQLSEQKCWRYFPLCLMVLVECAFIWINSSPETPLMLNTLPVLSPTYRNSSGKRCIVKWVWILHFVLRMKLES